MATETEVGELLHQRGWRAAFTVAERVNAWAALVGVIECGYGDDIYEYTNDLSCRNWLHEAWLLLDEHIVQLWTPRIKALDDRYGPRPSTTTAKHSTGSTDCPAPTCGGGDTPASSPETSGVRFARPAPSAPPLSMDLPSDTVFVFDQDEDLIVFETFVYATNYLEAIDVSDGEYTAAYSPDGGVLALTAPEGPEGSVVLTRTGRGDLADLERRVAHYWQRHQVGQPPRDPLHTARFLIDRDNQPRMGWLSRVTGLLRRNSPGAEPASSLPDHFTEQGGGS
ncbi:hypothetical protein [Streptomyces sp. NPDC047043]|uniref:hypothetical protein n=1 Tax=Streptomyces sp. NPDC047043 TaxID=3154497 RepID=UPI0033DA25C3